MAIWAYGVTTVPSRFDSVLPRTLQSLALAGFDQPRLFIDGWCASDMFPRYDVTIRDPVIGAFGNWMLGLYELYIRKSNATYYAMFQDDFITYKNLKQYLEACVYPTHGYWNLITQPRKPADMPRNPGWSTSNQQGRGAVALIFSNWAVRTLIQQRYLAYHPTDAAKGHSSIDGAVLESMKECGCKEWIHNPSLVLHTGVLTTIVGNAPQPPAESFRGEDFDALDLLKEIK